MNRFFTRTPGRAGTLPAVNGTGIRPRGRLVGYLCLSVVMAFSCGKSRTPTGILSEREMVKVMTEIYVAEEKTSRLGINRDSSLQVFDSLEKRIFEGMGTPDSVFKRSLDYYWQDPEKMEKIYTTLIDSLNLREQRLSLPTEE